MSWVAVAAATWFWRLAKTDLTCDHDRVQKSEAPRTFAKARRLRQHARRMRLPKCEFAGGSVILRYRVPVHHVPPGLNVICPAILIFQVVGVLPHIEAEDRPVAIHQRAVLIRRRNNLELAVFVFDQPCPAAAETACARRGKFFPEVIEAAERG